MFLNIYCEPLVLDSFTFDDYVQALHFKCEDVDCALLIEIHCALLKALVNEQGVIQAQLPELEEPEEEESEDEGHAIEVEEHALVDGNAQTNGDGSPFKANSMGSRKSIGKEKVHRVDELFEDGDSWALRLKSRDFKNGGWEAITVGLLHQLSSDPRFSRDIKGAMHLLLSNRLLTAHAVCLEMAAVAVRLRITIN